MSMTSLTTDKLKSLAPIIKQLEKLTAQKEKIDSEIKSIEGKCNAIINGTDVPKKADKKTKKQERLSIGKDVAEICQGMEGEFRVADVTAKLLEKGVIKKDQEAKAKLAVNQALIKGVKDGKFAKGARGLYKLA